jgi:FkbM family methyltransferase
MSRELLNKIANIDMLHADHLKYLWALKAAGFNPKVIYDIGSCVLHWSRHAKQIWPNAKIILFDAFEPAEYLYSGYDYHIGVLGNEDGKEVKFYQNDVQPGGNSYYREIGNKESATLFPDDGYILKRMSTLDTVVKDRGFPLPDFVKIDVQGAELDVIAGAINTFVNAKHLIAELQHTRYNMGAKLCDESVDIIQSYGWVCTAPLFANNGSDGDYGFSRTNSIMSIDQRHLKIANELKWVKRH